jgi:hypothetical protein
VWEFLTTDAGRESFWVERSESNGYEITLSFASGRTTNERVLREDPTHRFAMTYLGSEVTFELDSDGTGGTDLLVEDRGVSDEFRSEITAGWLNVLFPLKAAVDHGVDLRNHHPTRTWDAGWIDG